MSVPTRNAADLSKYNFTRFVYSASHSQPCIDVGQIFSEEWRSATFIEQDGVLIPLTAYLDKCCIMG